jgi:hypothetical protein
VKPFLKKNIRRYLQKAGIHIQRFPAPEQFYESLQYKPAAVKRDRLKRMARSACIAENHEYYERLLKAFVPSWRAEIKRAKFIGKGYSEGNLNTYRKVTIGEKSYFEKVYFNTRPDLQAVQWLQSCIYKLIKAQIKMPLIQKTYSGEFITIVYYNYLELTELEKEETERRLVQFSKEIYHISCKNELYLAKLEPPDPIKNINNRSTYKSQEDYYFAITKFMKQGIDIESVEELTAGSKLVLTHGDISIENSYKNNVLVDWDSFGLFPVGLDPAIIYYHIYLKTARKVNIIGWLEEHYKDIISGKDWSDFVRNCIFFSYFHAVKVQDSQKQQQLIGMLKKHL